MNIFRLASTITRSSTPLISGNGMQLTRLHIIDKATYFDALRNKRRGTQKGDIVAHRLIQILKGQEGDMVRIGMQVVLNLVMNHFVGKCEHATIGMVQDDDRIGP